METSPFRERLLMAGFLLSLIPEVVLELVHDAGDWGKGK